ncbi:MAG: hypothetical protein ACOH1X_04395 [Kaistella sp.]
MGTVEVYGWPDLVIIRLSAGGIFGFVNYFTLKDSFIADEISD